MDKHYRTLELDKILRRLADSCISEQAKENALNFEPATNLEDAQHLVKQTEDAYILSARFGTPSFSGVHNINNALARAEAGGLLNMSELLTVAGVLRSVRILIEWRAHSEGMKTSLDDMFSALYANKYLEDRINTCIISEEEMADTASTALYQIRRKISAAANRIRDKLDSMIKSQQNQKYLQDAVITQRNGRYVVPVKAECRSDVPGLVHDTSSTGATVFVEPMAVVEANNEMRILRSKESEEIERILYELSGEAASFAEGIRSSCRMMVSLDLIFARAKLAFAMKASVPVLNDRGIIDLRRVRHPLLDKTTVVPVDIRLGKDYDTLVITGPNTGGKTVNIKAIGLVTLMAACGMMIPAADESQVAVFGQVLADIGDEQSIEQSLSTFSSHIKNIIGIIDTADDNSLILLDELCSGTDPVEGAALATAILEKLRSEGAEIAATTHYAELKAYALDTDGVENACCEFDVATLAPTYKLLIGVPGRSNAFAISTRLGMSADVVDEAKSMVTAESSRFERVVEGLEISRKKLEDQMEAARSAREDADKMRREAEEKSAKLKEDYDRQIENARSEARMIADNARMEVNRILTELETAKREQSKHDISAARAAANAGFKKLDKIASGGEKYQENYVLPRPLKIGDTVIMNDGGSKATVISLPDSKNNLTVQAGIMKIKTNVSQLKLSEHQGAVNTPKSTVKLQRTGAESGAAKRSSLEIDLRGMTVDEAIMELDQYIDNAVLAGITGFTIIHGKGTGALRTGIHKYLRAHKQIRTYRLGVYGEGETGVTVVELK